MAKNKNNISSTSPKKTAVSQAVLEGALGIAKNCNVNILVLFIDGLDQNRELDQLNFNGPLKIILVARTIKNFKRAKTYTKKVVQIPEVQLSRMGQIKMSVMLALSKHYLEPNDQFVYLTGLATGHLDTLMLMEVGKEYEIFQSVDEPPLTERIKRAVFERVLSLALELAAEGREGKPIGAIFVIGDAKEVTENCRQNIINPFKGYTEKECNILSETMSETIKEFSSIDGAFIIKGNGAIISAGTYLLPKIVTEDLPQGLGARHEASAAITAATHSIAITISESTGSVRIWRQGRLITEIEKAPPATKP
jgi:DNA integrity scanning protein DisA with diadenylate cyclase activity